MASCTLCELPTGSDPVTAADVDGEFCCRGCLEVSRTFGDEAPLPGADETAATAPAEPAVPDDAETTYLSMDGMHCATCETFVETTAEREDGVYDATASYATEMLKVRYDGDAVESSALPDLVSRAGYRAAFPEDGTEDSAIERFGRDRLRALLGLLVGMSVMAFYVLFLYPAYLGIYPMSFLREPATSIMVFGPIPILSSIVLFVVGFPILRGAYVSFRAGQPNMDVLVAFGATAAYVYSLAVLATGGRVVYFDATVAIIAVVTAGDYLESRRRRSALETLSGLGADRVTVATVRDENGETREVEVDDLEPDQEMVVEAGERLPADGRVREGRAAVDEALVTGESDPVDVAPGADVLGGAEVLDGDLVVAVSEDATSTLDRIVTQMWDIESDTGRVQRMADRLAAVFVPFILVVAVAVAGIDLALGEPLTTAVLTGVSILVVSCPCALGLATPLAVATGVSRAASEDGVVVTNNAVLEDVADVDVVVLDKTGTLTTDEMTVSAVHAADRERLLARAAAVEAGSNHPVGSAIVDSAPDTEPVEDVESFPRGVAGTVDGERVVAAHPDAFRGDDWEIPDAVADGLEAAADAGDIATVVGWGGRARGVVAVHDEPRADWAETVSTLAGDDREIVVLTGDDQSSVARFAEHPDVDDVLTGVLPDAKAAAIRRLQDGREVAMVGDGINDAPALAAADLGVSIAEGSELAAEAADATVVNGSLEAIPALFERGRRTKRRVRQNLGWALGYNAVAIPLAALGLIDPLLAAIAMGASSLLVVFNSTR
ncbi:MAG: heavy metal translocating P-type ATPase [Haloarculaceae archaeon]